MAKKVRKDGERKEEKKAVFEEPEFDEREYLETELDKIRRNILFTLLAIPVGAVGAWVGGATGNGWVVAAVAVGVYAMLLLLLREFFGVDMLAEGERRQAIFTFGVFFLAFLAFSILFSNPPFIDAADPSITDIAVFVYKDDMAEDGWQEMMRHKDWVERTDDVKEQMDEDDDRVLYLINESLTASEGDDILILVRVGDPAGVTSVRLEWNIGTTENTTTYEMERVNQTRFEELFDDMPYEIWGEHYFQANISNVSEGNKYFAITAEDENGHTKTFETEYADSVEVKG